MRVFRAGQIEATLIPELWLLDRHYTQLGVASTGRRGATCSVADVFSERGG